MRIGKFSRKGGNNLKTKRILPILLVVVLIASIFVPVAAEENAGITTSADGYEQVAENEQLLLEADLSNGLFRLTDKVSGYVRYSVPRDATEDQLAVGQGKMQLQSQMVVYYRNAKKNLFVASSKASCINRNSIQVKKIDDGIRVDFIFREESFLIPVEYVLKETYLEVKVLTEEIQETADNKIIKMDILPYFLSGSQTESGYIMVPDGSGALIHFNNGQTYASDYYASVYGFDVTLDTEVSQTNQETARFPVCGIRNNEQAGMFGLVVNGDSLADIGAGVSGKKNQYNHTWFCFRYREEESINVMEQDMNSDREVLSMAECCAADDFVVRYYSLNHQNGGTTYSSMANLYRGYLLEEGKLSAVSSNQAVFLVDVLGSAQVKKSVLGVPTDMMEQLTTFSQASTIAEELQSLGITSYSMRYKGWGEDGLKNIRIPNKVTVQKGLGTLRDLQTLNDAFAEAGLALYLDVDPLTFMKNGNGIATRSDSIKNIFDLQCWQNTEDWFNKKSVFAPYLLLTPRKVTLINQQYVDSFAKSGFSHLSISKLGSLLYSDFSDDEQLTRLGAMENWQTVLSYAAEKTDTVMLDGGNVFTLVYADVVTNAPLVYSGYHIEDEEIPFYSMVTHGSVAMVTEPINLSSRQDYMILKAVESGVGLSYVCSAEDTAILKSTEFNNLFASYFPNWKDQAAKIYNRVYPFLNYIHSSKIISHEQVQPNVFKTEYENGAYSLVNYNNESVVVDGREISAMDFITSIDGTDADRIPPAGKMYVSVIEETVSYAWIWIVVIVVLAVIAGAVVLFVRKTSQKKREGGNE